MIMIIIIYNANKCILGLSSLFTKSDPNDATISEVERHETVGNEQFRPEASSSTNYSAQENLRPNSSQNATNFISQFIQNGGPNGNASQRSAISPIYGEVCVKLINEHFCH